MAAKPAEVKQIWKVGGDRIIAYSLTPAAVSRLRASGVRHGREFPVATLVSPIGTGDAQHAATRRPRGADLPVRRRSDRRPTAALRSYRFDHRPSSRRLRRCTWYGGFFLPAQNRPHHPAESDKAQNPGLDIINLSISPRPLQRPNNMPVLWHERGTGIAGSRNDIERARRPGDELYLALPNGEGCRVVRSQ